MHLRLTLAALFAIVFVVSSQANAQFVGSAKSDKYHKESCQHAKKILDEHRVEFATVEEAKEAGYVACRVCKPGGTTKSSSTTIKSENTQETSGGRCQATTKKGTQCKRNAAAGSNYCWQHK